MLTLPCTAPPDFGVLAGRIASHSWSLIWSAPPLSLLAKSGARFPSLLFLAQKSEALTDWCLEPVPLLIKLVAEGGTLLELLAVPLGLAHF